MGLRPFTSEPPVPPQNLTGQQTQRCPRCELANRIKAEARMVAGAVQRTWYCYGCGYEWPRD
jgi:transposase-like protein